MQRPWWLQSLLRGRYRIISNIETYVTFSRNVCPVAFSDALSTLVEVLLCRFAFSVHTSDSLIHSRFLWPRGTIICTNVLQCATGHGISEKIWMLKFSYKQAWWWDTVPSSWFDFLFPWHPRARPFHLLFC